MIKVLVKWIILCTIMFLTYGDMNGDKSNKLSRFINRLPYDELKDPVDFASSYPSPSQDANDEFESLYYLHREAWAQNMVAGYQVRDRYQKLLDQCPGNAAVQHNLKLLGEYE